MKPSFYDDSPNIPQLQDPLELLSNIRQASKSGASGPKKRDKMAFEFPEDFPGEMTDLIKAIGQMFMVGFSGYEVTEEIKELITRYHVGSIILSVKNLKGE